MPLPEFDDDAPLVPQAPVTVPAGLESPDEAQPLPDERMIAAPAAAKPPALPEADAPPAPQSIPAPAASERTHFGAGHCPRCGGTDFGKGTLINYGDRFRPAYYKPSRLSFRRLHNLFRPFRRVSEVEAQVCRNCGMVMLQVDIDRLRDVEERSGDLE